MNVEEEVKKWFAAHLAYRSAIETYNARLTMAREERARGSWCINVHAEYEAMHEAQVAAFAADGELYKTLRMNGW